MKKRRRWLFLGAALFVLFLLLIWASGRTPTDSRTTESWSRGRALGQAPVRRPVALQSAPDGGVVLVWPNLDGRLEMARVAADGEVLLSRVLPVETARPRDPQLRVGPDGRLHVLYRETEGARPAVRYLGLESDGTVVGQPRTLSDDTDGTADAPRLARGAGGLFHALWADGTGLRWAVLDGRDGSVVSGPDLLLPGAESPVLQYGPGGLLHLVWQQPETGSARSIYYAILDPEQGEVGTPEEIAEIALSGSLQLQEVALGLSQDTGHVFWSEYQVKFDRYRFMHASFPLESLQQRQVGSWQLKLGDGPLAIAPLDGPRTPPLVALSERMAGLGQEFDLQIALINPEREHAEERVVTASPQASLKPTLVADERAYLHLAWLETAGFGQYRVMYASTAPEVSENYNALTLWRVLNVAFSSVFQVAVVLVAVLVSLAAWAILPLVGLVVYHLVTSEETLDTVRARSAIIAALAVEVGLSFALPPRFGIDATGAWLRWVVPVVATAVAAGVTLGFMRRRRDKHLFTTFFLFTGMFCVLQVVLYLLFQR